MNRLLSDIYDFSNGNATVPKDSYILPPQCFVDYITQFAMSQGLEINLTDSGITHLPGDLVGSWAEGKPIILTVPGLSVTDVNSILNALNTLAAPNGFLDLSDCAAPTGQGLIDKAALIDNGWTVITE